MRCRRCCAQSSTKPSAILPADYDEARGIAKRARGALAELFDDVDVLLTFSAPGAAPKGLDWTGDPRFNRLWTLMGVPCVNIPAIVADGGLPVGVQVIARFGDDAGALAAARFVEEALARRCRIPSFRPCAASTSRRLSDRSVDGRDPGHDVEVRVSGRAALLLPDPCLRFPPAIA